MQISVNVLKKKKSKSAVGKDELILALMGFVTFVKES